MTDGGKSKVDFDAYADRYEALLKEQLAFFSSDRDYFSEYKIRILRALFPGPVGSILDFGCGIGLSLPHITKAFPEARVFATDISAASRVHVAETNPGVTVLTDAEAGKRRYDLICVITVIHHVDPLQLPDLLRRLEAMLAPGGRLCIFEHNPFNPVTRRMVSTCPFDADAVLISMRRLKKLIRSVTGLRISHSGYSLFFPAGLQALRPLESAIRWLPLGGQYFIVAEGQPARPA